MARYKKPIMTGLNFGIWIDYTNHKGVRAIRYVLPSRLEFGESLYHTGRQLFLFALDLDKKKHRDFAVSSIHEWFEHKPENPDIG